MHASSLLIMSRYYVVVRREREKETENYVDVPFECNEGTTYARIYHAIHIIVIYSINK